MKRIFLIFLFISFCLYGLFANVAAYSYGKGGMIYPIKSNVLSMDYEKIDIDVYGGSIREDEDGLGDELYYSYYYIEYHCFYQFKNNGNTRDFLLGFPVSFGKDGNSSCPEMNTSNPVFADMQLMVNDRHVDYIPYIHGYNPELADINYDEVYGFTVRIEQRETISVKVFYTTIQAADSISFIEPGVFYILKSGSTLQKPIGKANITVQIHTPVNVTVNESPGNYTVKKANEKYISTISWELTNVMPTSDISIALNSAEVPIESMTGELLREVQEKRRPGTCFSLILARQKSGSQSKSVLKKMRDVLIPVYKTCLEDSGTSANAAGFIISDIKSNPELITDATFVKNISQQLGERAIRYVNQEIDLAEKMLTAIKADPLNNELKISAYNFIDSLDHKNLEMLKNNYFMKLLGDRYDKVDFDDLYLELASSIQSEYFLYQKGHTAQSLLYLG